MSESIQEKVIPRNPLGIIALFVFFIEAVATVSLKIVADTHKGIVWGFDDKFYYGSKRFSPSLSTN